MTECERWLNTLLFKTTDRIPLIPGGGRKSTRTRWHSEGLPDEIDDTSSINEYAYELAGGKLKLPKIGKNFAVDERMKPMFEEKVIEKNEHTQIVQDWKGNICEISNEFTTEYLRNPIDFVTRRWIKCPVESQADWEGMKTRYNPDDISRLPENHIQLADELRDRDWHVELHFSGPFWQLREWVGFENLCIMFYDNPKLIRDMLNFWSDYIAALLENTFKYIIPDCFHISEDMAYKGFSMISPDMVRRYLLPIWKRWGDIARSAGVKIYAIDSDGYIGELIPIWIEAGFNCCDPVEVAAGNDIVEFRKIYGTKMAFRCGFDKRCIADGGKALEDETKRIMPVIKNGGYIPSCDHGVPQDVSWQNYVKYVGLIAKSTGWL
ncbi:MAG: Uroporphyrinogen decarboxylase (URO-D) [Planctomycetes bacterium ADurb.Bin401]|nr:MAG: Uroporphyrinogen decarboxylase (URO-D) [Planctomycetes bacterium ADurb.Bin401]